MNMHNLNLRTSNQILQHRKDLLQVYCGQKSFLAPGKSQQILEDYLDYFESELLNQTPESNISQIQEMLLELSCIIRSRNTRLIPGEYSNFLQRLIRIYGAGFSQNPGNAFLITAADYADVIEAISKECPNYDYSEALGQLLRYMSQLYKVRKSSWKTVYEHIQSMPDSITAVQMVKTEYFAEIQQWAEEGVGNLFQIRKDIYQRIEELEQQANAIEKQIDAEGSILATETPVPKVFGQAQIINLAEKRAQKRIEALHVDLAANARDILSQGELVALIESNIQEFDDKLREARRAYSIRLVHAAELNLS